MQKNTKKLLIATLCMLQAVSTTSFSNNPTKDKVTEKENTKLKTTQMCDFTFEEITYVMDLKQCHEYYPIQVPEYDPKQKAWTWYRISKRYDVDICTLLLLNEVAKPNELKAGQTVLIPNSNK